jgi:hypothetical protein
MTACPHWPPSLTCRIAHYHSLSPPQLQRPWKFPFYFSAHWILVTICPRTVSWRHPEDTASPSGGWSQGGGGAPPPPPPPPPHRPSTVRVCFVSFNRSGARPEPTGRSLTSLPQPTLWKSGWLAKASAQPQVQERQAGFKPGFGVDQICSQIPLLMPTACVTLS